MSGELKDALAEAISRGVRVQLLTKSLASTDHELAAAFDNPKRHFFGIPPRPLPVDSPLGSSYA